jgi:ankyrin repeat protein
MKSQLIAIVAAVLVVGCGESKQSAPPVEAEPVAEVPAQPSPPPVETKPVEPVAEAAKPKPPTTKPPDFTIHYAASSGNIEAVKQHLAAGADVNKRIWSDVFKGTITPLDSANLSASDNRNEVVNILKKHGGKADDWFNAHESVHKAASGGNIEVLKQHLAAGGDVNAKAEGGGTPLHLAGFKGHKEIAKLLITKGANVNAKAEGGGTALHATAWEGHKEVAELLIAAGADVNAKTDFGYAPLDYAEGETTDLLRKHGGKTGEELKAEGK